MTACLHRLDLHLRVFEPCEPDHDGVEDGQQDQIPRVGECVPVHLVGREECEDSYRRRIGPQSTFQQSGHQGQFDDPVRQQISGAKQLPPRRQSLAEREEITGDEIVRIFAQLVLCELEDQSPDVR